MPVDLSAPEYADLAKKEEKGIKGRYTSVERLMELPNGKVEWRMATCSTPGGNIPQVIAEKTMASKISEVRPFILTYMIQCFICVPVYIRMSPTSCVGSSLETRRSLAAPCANVFNRLPPPRRPLTHLRLPERLRLPHRKVGMHLLLSRSLHPLKLVAQQPPLSPMAAKPTRRRFVHRRLTQRLTSLRSVMKAFPQLWLLRQSNGHDVDGPIAFI